MNDTYTVTSQPTPINFAPTHIEEVLQCVRMIITTPIGSVPLKRDFGINSELLNFQTEDKLNELKEHIFDIIKKYEPRVTTKNVEVTRADGETEPLIQVMLEIVE